MSKFKIIFFTRWAKWKNAHSPYCITGCAAPWLEKACLFGDSFDDNYLLRFQIAENTGYRPMALTQWIRVHWAIYGPASVHVLHRNARVCRPLSFLRQCTDFVGHITSKSATCSPVVYRSGSCTQQFCVGCARWSACFQCSNRRTATVTTRSSLTWEEYENVSRPHDTLCECLQVASHPRGSEIRFGL